MTYRRADQHGDPSPIDPQLYQREDLRAALARHDFATVYRALVDEQGLSQRRIATLTGQAQSDVSDILGGRHVHTYSVLRRIVAGLGIPPELAGLSERDPDDADAYPGQVTVADSEEAEKLLRRHLLAQGGIAITGATVAKLGALLAELPGPPPVPLPSRLDYAHVTQVRDLTRRLDEATTTFGSNPEVSTASAAWGTALLGIPGAEPVRQALMVAAAQLHIQAGWAGFDAGLYRRALHHYSQALELGAQAGDAYLQALALNYAGLATTEHGHPNDGLKMLQCARVASWAIPARPDPDVVVIGEASRAAVEACGLADSATALAALGDPEGAHRNLMTSRQIWRPGRGEPAGDLDRVAASMELQRGRLDTAEQFAAASRRRWQGISQVNHAQSGAVLSTIYVTAGDSRGLPMAHQTLTDAGKLRSIRLRRQWVLPLAEALDTRPGADARDLARQARQVAAT